MDELLLRKMPYSAEAEQSVIGSVILNPKCLSDLIMLIGSDDFYVPENQKIYGTLLRMFNESKPIDPITVLNELVLGGVYDESGGNAYLMQVISLTPSFTNVVEYAKIVRDKAQLRRLAGAGSEIVDEVLTGENTSGTVLELAEQKLRDLRREDDRRGLQHIETVLTTTYTNLISLAKTKGKLPGLQTGFPDLDRKIAGLNKSDLIILAARPGIGKTSFVMNIAAHVALHNDLDVAVFNLEMSADQLVMRMLSSTAMVDSYLLRTADLPEKDWNKVADAATLLSRSNIFIDDTSNISVAEIKSKCLRLKNLGLVIIDYLQLMRSSVRTDNHNVEISDISRSLKILSKELNVPVICLSQLSRKAESRGDKGPSLSDLRDSGSIEQDADIVLMLYHEDGDNRTTTSPNSVICSIAKNRHGEIGTMNLQWFGQYLLFTQLDTSHENASYH